MKVLILAVLLSSCAVFDGAKTLLQGTYEAGKVRGKQEVLRELKKNKEEIEPFRMMILGYLQREEYEELQGQWKVIIAVLGPLLIERNKLKKELELATESTL